MNSGKQAHVILLLLLATGLIFTGNGQVWAVRVRPQPASAQAPGWPYPVITAANVTQLTEVETMGQGWISDATWSPDGSMLALAGAIGVLLYDGETTDLNEPPRMRLNHPGGAVSVAFSPDGTLVASGGRDHTVRLWDVLTGEELVVLEEHDNEVKSVAFGPDEKLLASGGYDSLVYLWNISSEEEMDVMTERHAPILALPDFESSVHRLSFSPDGTQLWISTVFGPDSIHIWDIIIAEFVGIELFGHKVFDLNASQVYIISHAFLTSSEFNVLSIRDANTFEEIAAWDTPAGWGIAVSPSGQWVATDEEGNRFNSDGPIKMSAIWVWDAQTGELQTVLEETYTFPIKHMAFNPDDSRLIVLGNDKREGWADEILYEYQERTISLWDVHRGEKLSGLESWFRSSVAISPDSRLLAVPSDDKQHIEIRNLETGQVTLIEPWSYRIAFSPDGEHLVGREKGIVRVWNIDPGEETARLEYIDPETEAPIPITSIAFHPDGTHILFGENQETYHDRVVMWNWQTNQVRELATFYVDYLNSTPAILIARIEDIDVSPDGIHWAAIHGLEDEIMLGDLAQSEEYPFSLTFEDTSVTGGLIFNPDGTFLAIATGSQIQLFDVVTKEKTVVLQDKNENEYIQSVAFSPDEKLLVAGGRSDIIVWDMQTQQQLTTLRGHAGYVTDVAFSADGTFIASASDDGTVRLWAVNGGQ